MGTQGGGIWERPNTYLQVLDRAEALEFVREFLDVSFDLGN
jgi:hypothetical protein